MKGGKKKFNLIGGGFQHAKTSTLDKESKYIEWHFGSKVNDITFYVDYQILNAIDDSNDGKTKFGWMLESRSIVPGLGTSLQNQIPQLREVYQCIFTHHEELILKHPDLFRWCPAYGTYIHDPCIPPKTKMISMIASNKRLTALHNFRINFALANKDRLDLYGRGFNPIPHKEEGLKDYMFSVAIENDSYDTYFTEKLTDCFALGTVPIYMGSPNIGKYFNIDGIIILDKTFDVGSLTAELYQDKLEAIKDNFNRVLKLDVLEDWMYETYFL